MFYEPSKICAPRALWNRFTTDVTQLEGASPCQLIRLL
jgi:hypothetical protein